MQKKTKMLLKILHKMIYLLHKVAIILRRLLQNKLCYYKRVKYLLIPKLLYVIMNEKVKEDDYNGK